MLALCSQLFPTLSHCFPVWLLFLAQTEFFCALLSVAVGKAAQTERYLVANRGCLFTLHRNDMTIPDRLHLRLLLHTHAHSHHLCYWVDLGWECRWIRLLAFFNAGAGLELILVLLCFLD